MARKGAASRLKWRVVKLEPVATRTFRPEQVTEGSIAVDDDLTTPVFSHYSGRVIKVIAMLGDVVPSRSCCVWKPTRS
jgi:membrane fusion protein, heavy metal efflux system